MSDYRISGLADPTDADDAVTRRYVASRFQALSDEVQDKKCKLDALQNLLGVENNQVLIRKYEQVAQRATIAHLSPMCQGQISFQKIQTHPSFNACSCYMKVSKGSNQKQQRKSGNTIFPIIRSIGVFLRRSRAANSVVGGPIWPKFELIHNIMHVLVTSKFEKDRININRDYMITSIF